MRPRTEPAPRRARQLVPAGMARRRELIAACAVAVVLAHLLLAQLTLVLAVTFVVVSRASRWRRWWLLCPAAAGLAWMLAIGPDQALAGFAAGPSSVLRQLGLGAGLQPHAAHPLAAFAGLGRWLPRQLPAALPLAAAEAALAGWLGWLHTDEWAVPPPRPGLVAALRAAAAARRIGAGAVLTRDGCALGIAPATGATAELSWTEISRGVLVTGAGEREVTLACLQVVHAALRRRRPVIVLDDGQGTAVSPALTAACRATGTPLLTEGSIPAGDNPAAEDDFPAGSDLAAGGTASASRLWGRASGGNGHPPAPGDPSQAGLTARLRQLVIDRTAALVPVTSPELAARACGALRSLAADLRRIGVDGDALVWVPRAEGLPPEALAALLRDGAAAGLPVLAAAMSPAAAAQLGALAGTTLVRRVTDPGLAATLAARAGTRLLPPPAAAKLAGPSQEAAPWPAPGQAEPAVPAASGTGPAPLTGAWPTAELVPGPVIAARSLLTLGPAEFVLAVTAPRPRLIASGRLVPARLPRQPAPPGAARRPAGPAAGAVAGQEAAGQEVAGQEAAGQEAASQLAAR